MRQIALTAGVGRIARLMLTLATVASAMALGATSAQALTAHGQLLHLAPGARANANQSSNWFGYNQGTLEQGDKLFHSIAGQWTVPKATQHTKGQAEYSSDWIGIGGGCVDSGCTVSDSTLIQTGTEQDVSSSGAASYDAWYELIPAPSLTITNMTIKPGNRMSASIAQVASGVELWTITIKDLSTGQSYSTTVPYPSTMDTAEWIEETPLILGTNAGFAALPNLTSPRFDLAKTNGAPAGLKPSEEMQLVNSSGSVIGDPSAPDPDHDGFSACTWSSACTRPATAGRPRAPASTREARPSTRRTGAGSRRFPP
jgi:hypothetical protein